MKPLFSTLFLTVLLLPALAQKQWELRLLGGYDFSTASQYRLSQDIITTGSSTSRAVNTSLGRGVQIGGDVTWWTNRYFGIMAGAGWLMTTPTVKGSSSYGMIDYSYSSSETWRSQLALTTAGIALKIPDTKLSPYARMGLLLPVYSHLTSKADWGSTSIAGSTNGKSETAFKLRSTAGYTAALGIAPRLDKLVSVFAEIHLQSLAILARHSELTSYSVKGVDQLGSYNTYFREVDYVKKISDYTYDADKPQKQLIFSFPYSSIGIHAGIIVKL